MIHLTNCASRKVMTCNFSALTLKTKIYKIQIHKAHAHTMDFLEINSGVHFHTIISENMAHNMWS